MGRMVTSLGVTGGIGSGKTSVCKVFNVLGVPVFSADSEARIIMENDPEIIKKVKLIAGRDLYSEGSLDRNELAKLIFNDSELLQKINSLVHPVVFDCFLKWKSLKVAEYVILEAAILFESGATHLVDKTVTVVAPIEERVERVMKRNSMTWDQVMERIRNQMDDETRIGMSDFVIQNSENDMIIPSILTIHDSMLKLNFSGN